MRGDIDMIMAKAKGHMPRFQPLQELAQAG
jgi:hypothetical protein